MMYIPPDVAAWLRAQQQQSYEADQKNEQIIKVKQRARCLGCGRFMALEGAHLNIMPMGYCHMRESCVTILVTRIRHSSSEWDWNRNGNGMSVPLRNEDSNAEQNSGIQTEGEGDREV